MMNFDANSSVSWPEERVAYVVNVWEEDYGHAIAGIFEYESEANLVASRIREESPGFDVNVCQFPINKDLWINPYGREEEDED